jgi:glyoxylase-like metal-dependent hydrolase (beta-lactamase superfamily II)
MVHFRQLHDARSRSFAYLLADVDRREAVIVDPAAGQATLYLALLDELRSQLTHVLLTHVHGNVAKGADEWRGKAVLVASRRCGLTQTEWLADDRAVVAFGDEILHCRATPGHTAGCVSYLWRDRVFTGDALLIGDCGSSSADGGDAGMLFDSITRKLLPLPDETLIYPAHDSAGRRVSCIGEQREANSKLAGTTRDEFIAVHSRISSQHEVHV